MIWRLLELAILGWIVWTWIQRALAPVPSPRSSPRQPTGTPGPPTAMTLIRCATCGTHVPIGRAAVIDVEGRAYCSEVCRPRPGGES